MPEIARTDGPPRATGTGAPALRVEREGAHLAGLIWTLVRTDFKTRYHGTIGGFLWALLKPVTMFFVLYAVFSFVFASNPAYKLNLIVGLFLYDFFGEATKTGLLSLRAKGFLLTKARFPRWVLVVTSSSNAVITLTLFSAALIVVLLLQGHAHGPATVALYVWYQVQYLGIVTGFSLAASVLFMRFRDLNQIWEVVIHAGFFVAPIIYPLDILPERLHIYLYLWPPTPVMMFSRAVLVDGTIPSLAAHVYLAAETLVIVGVGALIYRLASPRIAEYV
jgi:lipopolysaccharide transport system permease protein